MRFPDMSNQVEILHVDATPDGGYALRILRAYRDMCDSRYIVMGMSENEQVLWNAMNQWQAQRAGELDRAIATLEGEQA